jgi:outer membrane protein OmpA-like peptidoglycan-associated protein
MEDSMSHGFNVRKGSSVAACVFALLAVVAISGSAFAQSDSNPKYDLFVGYQYLHPGATVPTGDPNNPTPYTVPDMTTGLGAAFTFNMDPHWGAEFDFGHNWNSSDTETTASAGPRFIWRTDGANYFAHALLSYNHLGVNGLTNGSSGIGAIIGGGMELPITKTIAWRLFQVDYVWSRHNYADYASEVFPDLRRPNVEGVRLRTGLDFTWGGAEPLVPAASCSVQPTEVLVGEPITATVSASNFNPKHTVSYSWSGNGGTVTGKDTTATIDTNNATPGSYAITAKVTDAREKKNNEASCSANYTIKPLPPKNPPTISISASPSDLVTGGSVNLSASCSSPDSVQVSVANWTTTAGTLSGSGTSATLSTTGVPPGTVTVTATCTDSRGLTAQGSAQVTLETPPPPPVDKALEARLALHSVYFPTAMPPVRDPNAGLIASQQRTLVTLATDFKKYLEAMPDAHIILGGHADIRGSDAYNQALSERRVAKVKSFLVEQGVPEANIETTAYGKERNLTLEEVKASIENNSELTTEERKRALARIQVIKLASNRRVDVTLKSAGQTETSVRQFPFNAADALTLIGGRESEMKAKQAPRKKPVAKKPPAKQQ